MANRNPSPATRFKKGQVGNPRGVNRSPVVMALRPYLRAELSKPCAPGSSITNAEMVAYQLVQAALSRDVQAIRLLLLYLDGAPKGMEQMPDEDRQGMTVEAIRQAIGIAS